jgi:beta-lactamase regulating signal transducer with metallopeptidase domain
MLTFILEAALRSMIMALAVWGAIRMLRVQAVLAQKVAWVLVLAAAAVMPMVMHSPKLALHRAVRIPLQGASTREAAQTLMHRLEKLVNKPAAQSSAAKLDGAVTSWNVNAQTANAQAANTQAANTQAANTQTIAMQNIDTRSFDTQAGAHAWAASAVRMAVPATASPKASFLLHRDDSGKHAQSSNTIDYGSRIVNLPVMPLELSVKVPASITRNATVWDVGRLRMGAIFLYAVVVVLLLLRTIAGLSIAVRVLARSKKVHGLLDDDGRAMRVRSSVDLATPVTIGSTILLPADYTEWDAEKLRVVLAHEHSHVRQGDFYLQLAATVHAAIFWFSPLGWWLKRKLSELGEALSDRAALEYAEDAASYAQVLLEFAAAPRRAPLAGVAMARRSNLSSRIERILNDRRFQLAFLGGRRHAVLAAAVVPVALIAAVAGFQVVPAVHAAGSANATATTTTTKSKSTHGSVTALCTQGSNTATVRSITSTAPQDGAATMVAVSYTSQDAAPVAPAAAAAPIQAAPAAPTMGVSAPESPEPPPAAEDSEDSDQTLHNQARPRMHAHTVMHSGDDGESFSIIHQNGNGSVQWNGEYNDEVARTRKKMNLKGDYIWFERDGKSYVITDPAILAQADAMFREDPALARQQKALEEKQKVLEKQMADFNPEKIKIKADSPEFKKQMSELNAQIAKLQSDEFKKHMDELNKQINQEVLAKLQEQMGSIQEQIGQLQGQLGEQMGKLGEKQGELGEKMGELGEQIGNIGEEQGRRAEEAGRKMQSVLDQALRSGKAKPVE